MTVDVNKRFNNTLVTQLSKRNNEPNWMLDLRLEALKNYQQLPLPELKKTKIDKWNIDQFEIETNEPIVENFDSLPKDVKKLVEENKANRNVLVQKNSTVIYQEISKNLTDQGVIYSSLKTALKEYPDLVKNYFMKSIGFDDNKLIALHTALWNDGIFLYVPKNVEVEVPVQALFIGEKGGILPHIIIVAEKNSSITYIDNYLSIDLADIAVHNGVVELFVGEGAKVRYASIHNFNSKIDDYTYRKAVVDRYGKVELIIGEMNDGNTVSNNTSYLKKSSATADIKSIFIGTGKQRANFVAEVIHKGEYTESNILSHGVMLNESTAIFNGVTKIEKGAIKSNASQTEKILMLSSDARGEANPILLIDEYDVKAGHAASAGPVNPNDIFYLMSRGITEDEAKRLIIHGFLSPVVAKISIDGIKKLLENVIERKLKND